MLLNSLKQGMDIVITTDQSGNQIKKCDGFTYILRPGYRDRLFQWAEIVGIECDSVNSVTSAAEEYVKDPVRGFEQSEVTLEGSDHLEMDAWMKSKLSALGTRSIVERNPPRSDRYTVQFSCGPNNPDLEYRRIASPARSKILDYLEEVGDPTPINKTAGQVAQNNT